MRTLIAALALGVSAAALLPSHEAKAWWDVYGRWHPGFYVRPPVVVAPRPYARWIPPHYDPWGRFVPGHYI
jgi:hypothetical protein